MVDRQTRDAAATLLQAFMDGTISNYKYDNGFPRSESDPALRSIWVNLWFGYSDVREHTLTGKHALTQETRAVYERCLLFLKSDLEFQWPPSEIKLRYGLLRLLGFGRALKQREDADMSVGEKEFWPFLRKEDYGKTVQSQIED